LGYSLSQITQQQKNNISITRQPGLPEVKTKWITFSGGGAQTDALLSGGVDMVNTGVGNLLLLWDRTKGGVKGIVASSALPPAFAAARFGEDRRHDLGGCGGAHDQPQCIRRGTRAPPRRLGQA
jgi:hypothetical protein